VALALMVWWGVKRLDRAFDVKMCLSQDQREEE
jgi:hypothetical protein